MKRAFVLVSLLMMVPALAARAGDTLAVHSPGDELAPARSAESQSRSPPVVVELFTSQGSSTSPPADAYLGELASRPGVFALAFHVDYWNYIGWTDPFATKAATDRQRGYAKQLGLHYVYTPQMVINGTVEGVGSGREAISQLIAEAAADKNPHVGVAVTRGPAGQILVHIDAGQTTEPATVWLVGFDREHATQVLRGENEGQLLRDYQVVRSLKEIGTWTGAALDLSLAENAATGDGGVGVLVQLRGTGRILGAGCVKTPTS
jgi:hypothetical protein